MFTELRKLLGDASLFEQRLSLDFQEFEFNQLVITGKTSESRENIPGFAFAVMVNQPTRREWHEEHADQETQAREDLEAHGHKPRCVALLAKLSTADVVGATKTC